MSNFPVKDGNGVIQNLKADGTGASGDPFIPNNNVTVVSALPAGDNNIGDVDVATLPALAEGSNNIGNVGINSALPEGDNNIGNVDIVTMPNVTIGSSALPTGAATSGKQDTGNTSLSSIDGKITACNTGAVVVSSSALPSGAATAAKQPALGTVGSPSADVLTVQGATSMTALKVDGSGFTQPVSDGGNSLTVDGTVTVQDGGGSLTVDNGGTFAVQAAQTGTWNVTNISGTVSLPTGAATESTLGDIKTSLQLIDDTVATDGSTAPTKGLMMAGTDSTNAQTISTNSSGHINIADGGNSLTVDNAGTFAVQATQAGTWVVQPSNTANTTPWLTSINDGSNTATVRNLSSNDALNVAICDASGNQISSFGGGTQYTDGDTEATPTGTVALGKDGSDILKALSLDGSGNLNVNVASGGGAGGTSSDFESAIPGTGTAAGFSDGTNMQLARVFDGDTDGGTEYNLGVILRKSGSGGTVEAGTSSNPLRIDPTGTTAQPVSDGGGSLTVDGTVAATQSGTWTLGANSGVDIGDVTINNASGASAVNIQDGGNSITVDNGGTFAVQDSQVITDNTAFTDGTSKVFVSGHIFDEVAGTSLTENDAAASRIDSKRAQVFTLEDATTRGRRQTVSAGGAALVDAQQSGTWTVQPGNTANTTAWKVDNSAVNQPVVGNVANDASDSGNPVKVGGVARTTNPTAVTNGDRVDCFRDDVGRSIAVLNQCRDLVGNQQTTITSSTSETTIVTAGGSGVFNDLTSLTITNSSATALIVTLKDSLAGTTRGIYALAANGGIVLTFITPKAQSSSNAAWTLTCGSSVDSIYVVAEFVKNV